MKKPLAIDLCCGLGGFTEGLLAEGYEVVGIDIEAHVYGEHRYPADLMLRDVTTIHGSLFRDADLIVASPPCQEYSWMAMPWSKAKAKAAAIRADKTGAELARLNRLFNECFRIQREASAAAGQHIPIVVENVRGAQPWVGRARWNFGSFYLWGDVPALMPPTVRIAKMPGHNMSRGSPIWGPHTQLEHATKLPGFRFDGSGRSFQSASVGHVIPSGSATGDCVINQDDSGAKHHDSGAAWWRTGPGKLPSASPRRKFASAMIAKIPEPLSRHIARSFKPHAD